MNTKVTTKVLAVASAGGHWVQLMRLQPLLDEFETVYVSTDSFLADEVAPARFHQVPDGSRWNKLRLLSIAWKLFRILRRERPQVVLSTGAAPGFLALRIGKWLGMRTAWIDSIANSEELSLCGHRIGRHADLWLTQWPHLARPDGPDYRGAVL